MKAIDVYAVTGVLLGGVLVGGCSDSGRGQRTARVAQVVQVPKGEVKAVGLAMFAARAEHQVTSVGADLVLITGGVGRDGQPLDTAEAVDVRTGQRFALPDRMTQRRRGHVALLLPSGDVLIAGGRDETGADLDTCEVWSPSSDAFTPIALRLSAPRYGASGLVVGDDVVIAGGEGQASADVLSAKGLTLRGTIASLPGGGHPHGQAVLLDGANQVMVYGGALRPAVLDTETLTARELRGPIALGGAAVVANLEGAAKTYVVGGALDGRPTGAPQLVDEAEAPTFASQPVSPSDVPTVLGGDGFIYTAGGFAGGNVRQDLEVVTASGTRRSTPLLRARAQIEGAALPGGAALLSGGVDANGEVVAAMEILTRVDLAANPAFEQATLSRADFERRLGELHQANKQIAAVQAQVTQAMAQLAGLQAQEAGERAKNAVLADELAKAQAEVARLTAERDRLQREVRRLQARISALTARAVANQAATRAARTQLVTARARLAATNAQLSAAQTQASSLQGQLSAAQSALASLRSQQASLQASLNASSSSLSVRLKASARLIVIGATWRSTVSFAWQSTDSKAEVSIQVKSDTTFRSWLTILRAQPASDIGSWSAYGQPGETLNFRAVATVGAASSNSNTVTLN